MESIDYEGIPKTDTKITPVWLDFIFVASIYFYKVRIVIGEYNDEFVTTMLSPF